jgi:hypothetical protein
MEVELLMIYFATLSYSPSETCIHSRTGNSFVDGIVLSQVYIVLPLRHENIDQMGA